MGEIKQGNTQKETSLSKLFFLSIMSIALCSFGPIGVFTAVPLTMIVLIFGKPLALISGILSVVLMTVGLTAFNAVPLYVIGSFALSFVISILISEVVKRNIAPMKGLIVIGFTLVTIIGALVGVANQMSEVSVKDQIGQSVTTFTDELKKQRAQASSLTGDEERAFEDLVNNPEKLATQIYQALPMIVFMYTFFILWVTFFVVLRNQVVWKKQVSYSYSVSHMANYRAPDFLVYPVIASLVLWLGADYGLPKYTAVIGENLLYCLGIFYFFQGFGVYNALLNHLRIRGFVKTLFIAFTVLLAFRFLALVGLFDLWFDFRKFFKNKKKNEGDTI